MEDIAKAAFDKLSEYVGNSTPYIIMMVICIVLMGFFMIMLYKSSMKTMQANYEKNLAEIKKLSYDSGYLRGYTSYERKNKKTDVISSQKEQEHSGRRKEK